jgi:hypothetical protein
VDDVEVVHHAPEEALAERQDDGRVAGADGLLYLLRLLPPGRLDQVDGDVVAADDLARLEERLELCVVDDDAAVAEVAGRVGQRLEHGLDRRVVALHRPHLDDLSGAVTLGHDRVRVGERDAHRLLDEDVQAGIERPDHDLRVRPGRGADDDRVEPAGVEHRSVVGMQAADPVARAERLAHGPARLRQRGQREPVAERREVWKVFGLGDETPTDDAHPYRQAASRTACATFSNAKPISSRSCSSLTGERST